MLSRFSGFVPLLVVTMTFAGCGDDLTTEATTPQQGPTSPQGPQATPPNVAPIAVAGPDQTAECGSFNGSAISLTSRVGLLMDIGMVGFLSGFVVG